MTDQQTLNVANIDPMLKHDIIFEQFASLNPGKAITIINDHDPVSLHYRFQKEHAGEAVWEFLEEGPVRWRFRITKRQTQK